MIRLQRITTADTDLYSYMEKLMTQSFPSEEYRELEELRKYTDTKTHFYNNIIFHNNTPVGLITYWDFGHFYYIEHFAIDPALCLKSLTELKLSTGLSNKPKQQIKFLLFFCAVIQKFSTKV